MRKVTASELASVDAVGGSSGELTFAHLNMLEKLSDLSPELALRKAVPYLTRLVQEPTYLKVEIRPLLQVAQRAKGWYVARRHRAPTGAISLQVFVWPPETRTRIHDRSSWGAFCCAVGSVL